VDLSINNGDFPMSYVSLPEGKWQCWLFQLSDGVSNDRFWVSNLDADPARGSRQMAQQAPALM